MAEQKPLNADPDVDSDADAATRAGTGDGAGTPPDHEAETIASSPRESERETAIAAQMITRIPEKIGHYNLKRVIAAGGMGVVYEAIQEHPRRTVALKIMKQGIATRSALRRFEYESQILARLRHPGIAQIYEAGMHDDGTGGVPFFAMEYIAGAKDVIDYARSKGLSTKEKLELFTEVCEAVHHGHQKGIIHRDLKPANILVDSAGQPKIIDFGVARATDSDQAVTTLQTDVGQLVGTVQYMSPEQIEADPHDIDTRSDVYALGVVLYKLLTDKFPYNVAGTVIYEATRIIREEQPKRISTINTTLRGDVETIVLHALEKNRDRRYQSAIELAQDIQRYLSNRTIQARPPTLAYQAKTFVKRNKVLVGGVAAVFVALVLGIVGTSWQSRVARIQRDAAERRFGQVRELANAFMFDFHDSIEKLDGATPAREMLVTTALKYLDGLAAEAGDNTELISELAKAYDQVGDIRGGVSRGASLGDTNGAMESYRMALDLREDLAAHAPDDLDLQADISTSHIRIGDVLEYTGDLKGALASFQTALAIRETLAEADPEYRRVLAVALNTTGDALKKTGRIREAGEHYERALAISKQLNRDEPENLVKLRDLTVAHGKVGDVLTETGDYEGAVVRYREMVRLREKLLRKEPDSGRYKRDLAVAHLFVGRTYLLMDRPEKAMEHLQHFLKVTEERVESNPKATRPKRDLAIAHEFMGQALAMTDELSQARVHYEQYQALVLPLSDADPGNTHYRELVATSYERLGELEGMAGAYETAIEHFRQALRIIEELVDADPESAEYEAQRAGILRKLGGVLARTEAQTEARFRLESAAELYESLSLAHPDKAEVKDGLAGTREELSELVARREGG